MLHLKSYFCTAFTQALAVSYDVNTRFGGVSGQRDPKRVDPDTNYKTLSIPVPFVREPSLISSFNFSVV